MERGPSASRRDATKGAPVVYRFDRFHADDDTFRLTADGEPVSLEPKTLRLLLYLIQNPGRLLRKQEILDAVWADAAVTENALTRSVGLLRKALDDDSREPRFVETVPTAGYRFIAAVETLPAGPSEPEAKLVLPPAPRVSRLRRRHLAAILVCCLILLAAVGWLTAKRVHTAPIHSLAVLPLENLSGDPAQDYFADGMTDELITDLARIPNLRVVSRTSVMADKGVRKPLPEIARELDVDAIVEGSTVRSGDRVRITAQLIDARTDRHLWAQSFEGSANDVLSVQDSVARQIAQQARAVLVPAPPRPPINAAAQDAYLRGRYFFNKEDYALSDQNFQQAISLAPDYANAYAGLATALDAEAVVGVLPMDDAMRRAIDSARRAIQLDPGNAEAYSELGSAQTVYEWKWPEAEQNLTHAIALSPSNPVAEFKYSAWLDAMGRTADAVTHMRRAVSLDPLSFLMNRRLGTALYLDRQYDAAITQLTGAAEMEPSRGRSFDPYLSLAYQMKGLRDQAVDYDLQYFAKVAGHPVDTDALAAVYKRDGWKAYWRARAAAIGPAADNSCFAIDAGSAWTRAGDSVRAFAALNRAVDLRCFGVIQLRVDPQFDSVRSDPRYIGLLHRLNLPS